MSARADRLRARARKIETRERRARQYRRTVARMGRPGMIRDALAFAAIGAAFYAFILHLPALAGLMKGL